MQLNWPIAGHEKITEYLKTSIKNGQLSQAYLFVGPSHVGKKHTAQLLITSLLCQAQDPNQAKPCAKCFACKAIQHNGHPDFINLSKEEEKKQISIEQVREVINRLNKKPALAGYQIAIINQIEKISTEAANALLKTLEEPGHKTLLILLADQDNILPTIKSRCQIIKFQPVKPEIIENHIKTTAAPQVSLKDIKDIANITNGKIGLAQTLASNYKNWTSLKDDLKEALNLATAPLHEKFKKTEKLADEPNHIEETITHWTLLLHQIIKQKDNKQQSSLLYEELQPLTSKTWPEIHKIGQLLEALPEQIRRNVNPRLSLENFFLNF